MSERLSLKSDRYVLTDHQGKPSSQPQFSFSNSRPPYHPQFAATQVRTNTNNSAWTRGPEHQQHNPNVIANAFQFGDGHGSSATTYQPGGSVSGHIYEEVGPPSNPPPYMETRVPGMHPAMDPHHHYRESPISMCGSCGTCSSRFNMHHQPLTSMPSLPPNASLCNCADTMIPSPHTMSHQQQPHCCSSMNSSIPGHQMHTSSSPLTLPHLSNSARSSPTQVHTSIHHTGDHRHMTCPLHQHGTIGAVNNQRYTATMMLGEHPHNQTTDSNSNTKANSDSRSLSPFAFLRKHNRDSKASTNTMLDSSSSKSLLMCNRKWLVAIVLTLVLILVLSVAVGLVVTFTVHDSTKEVTTNSNQKQSVEKETARLNATVRVSSGERSTYYPAYRQKSSQEFQTYASAFISEVNAIFKKRQSLTNQVNHIEVARLSEGSVIVDFIVHLNDALLVKEAETLASQIKVVLHSESNRTTDFSRKFPVSLASIKVQPMLADAIEITTPSVTIETTEGLPVTEAPTTIPVTEPVTPTTPASVTIPPESGQCQPITNNICQRMGYNNSGTTFPNFVGHRSQEETNAIITVVNAVWDGTGCYPHLNTFTCALLNPKCGADNHRLPPCRRMCEEALSNCSIYLNTVELTPQGTGTDKINCTWFPDSTDPNVCVDKPPAPTLPSTTCPGADMFTCDNGTCHEMRDRCDYTKDCTDKTDEDNCENFQCVEGQFQCSNNNCRPKVWRCDGRDDCGDGSDEEGCEGVGPCAHGEFKCAAGHDAWGDDESDVCIEGSYTCDDTWDCSDGSDEDVNFCRADPGKRK